MMTDQYENLMSRLRAMQRQPPTPSAVSLDQPIVHLRYRKAVHSAAAAARILDTSSKEEIRQLAEALGALGQDSNLRPDSPERLGAGLDQAGAELEALRASAIQDASEKSESKNPAVRFPAIRQLIELGELDQARNRLEGTDAEADVQAFHAHHALTLAEGDIRRAEARTRAIFGRNPDFVARSGVSPDFLLTVNGAPPAISIVGPASVASAAEFLFYIRYLIFCDRQSDAINYALEYLDKQTPPASVVNILLATFVSRIQPDEIPDHNPVQENQNANTSARIYSPSIARLQNSVATAIANPESWPTWRSLAAKAVGLFIAQEQIGCIDERQRHVLERLAGFVFVEPYEPSRAALSELGYRPLSAAMDARQECLLSVAQVENLSIEAIQAAQTSRAKAFLSDLATNRCGGMLFSMHLSTMHGYGNLPLFSALASGLPTVSVVVGAFSVEKQLRERQNEEIGHQLRIVGRASGSVMEITSDLLATLRNGGIVGIAMDVVYSPGVTSTIPWFVRPISVPPYPASLAIAQRCRVGLSVTWLDEDGNLRDDTVEVKLPPPQGSTAVLSAWLTQRLAREARLFVRDNRVPIDPAVIVQRGGVPPKRKLVSLEEWVTGPGVGLSLAGWIAKPGHGAGRSAISFANSETSFDVLRELTLRMANVLMHYETAASDHVTREGAIGRQHRIMMILPQGPAFAATALAGLAVGNLIGLCQDDVTTSQLAARFRTFGPDLVISTASAWSRVVGHVPEAIDQTVLIMDDRGDVESMEDVLRGFEAVDALPPMEMHAPGPVIFTSGSTGVPKGCVHPQGVLVSADFTKVVGADVLFQLKSSDRMTYIARWESVCFFDILSCFRAGATAVVPDQDILASPIDFSRWLTRENVTCFAAPATLMGMMLQSRAFSSRQQPALRLTMPWGERISRFVTEELYKNLPEAEHVASYGASEALWVGYGPLPRIVDNMSMASPGGTPVPQLELSIVSDDGRTLSPDEVGHPRVSGPGVMLGYLDDLAAHSADRATGGEHKVVLHDFARITPAGLELFGRSDSIHKIAGRRISLIEIETAAEMVEGVKEAVAFIDEGRSVARVLVAVVLETGASEQVSREIGNSIAERCFESARPSRVLALNDFPRLPSNKCDRKAVESILLDKSQAESTAEVTAPSHPRNDLSPLLSEIADWASSRFGIPAGAFDPDLDAPDLDSLMVMELLLIAESVHGEFVPACAVRRNNATWADLAVQLGDRKLVVA